MKGHVGGGPGSGSSRCRVLGKTKPFHRSSLQGFGFGSGSYMSFTFPYVIYVQERLLEMSVFVRDYSSWSDADIKLESLILAQNERWRHA